MKINNKKGINETFAARPDLEKVYVTEDGRHFFNEAHAKAADGFDEPKKDKAGKLLPAELKKVKYSALERGAKELKEEAPAA